MRSANTHSSMVARRARSSAGALEPDEHVKRIVATGAELHALEQAATDDVPVAPRMAQSRFIVISDSRSGSSAARAKRACQRAAAWLEPRTLAPHDGFGFAV
jgi:hypothetical protein